jgi:hypothetical protein
VVQAAHHRVAGRSHGKLLPRYAGPVAQFLVEHPQATRWDVLDFIAQTWGVSVSRVALNRFLKKYGLDEASRIVPVAVEGVPFPDEPKTSAERLPDAAHPATAPLAATAVAAPAPGVAVPLPPQEFFLPAPTTPAPSCCCPTPAAG